MAGLIPGVRNAGVILEGLSALPGSTQMLVVTSGGVMQSQAIPGSSVAWGSITGTLSSQTDLQWALDGKAALVHTHVVSDLVSIASGKLIGRHGSGEGAGQEIGVDGGLEFHGGNLRTAAITGDVSIAAGGSTATIANDAVTYAKMQNVSATDRLLGRSSAGSGDIEEITCTAAGRSLLDDADAAAQRTTLELGSSDTPTFLGALLTGGTVTTSTPLINATQTWNSSGTVFTGMRLNVTDTNSSASSLLMDLQTTVSSTTTSRFSLRKNGVLTITGPGDFSPELIFTSSQTVGIGSYAGDFFVRLSSETPLFLRSSGSDRRVQIGLNYFLGFNGSAGATADPDLKIFRDAAGTIGVRNGTNAQRFNLYGTFTNSSNYERLFLEYNTGATAYRIGTEKAGTGSARALELQTDATTRLTIGTTGLFTIADALDIAVGTTTGTKIGTATTQKLGFYNSTPVVQPTAVADATDAASVITQLNALLTRMRNLGLIAT